MVDPGSESGQTPDERMAPPSMPRWVKLLGIIALVLVVALIVIMLLIGGEHGPGRHTPGGDGSGVGILLVDATAGG